MKHLSRIVFLAAVLAMGLALALPSDGAARADDDYPSEAKTFAVYDVPGNFEDSHFSVYMTFGPGQQLSLRRDSDAKAAGDPGTFVGNVSLADKNAMYEFFDIYLDWTDEELVREESTYWGRFAVMSVGEYRLISRLSDEGIDPVLGTKKALFVNEKYKEHMLSDMRRVLLELEGDWYNRKGELEYKIEAGKVNGQNVNMVCILPGNGKPSAFIQLETGDPQHPLALEQWQWSTRVPEHSHLHVVGREYDLARAVG